MTVHNSDFMREAKFAEAYRLAKATGSFENWEPTWRVYICCWCAQRAANLEGDFVECGVNRGGYSRAVMHYIDFEKLQKKFWLLDTYEGIPEHLLTQEERAKGMGTMDYDDCYRQVQGTFSEFKNVEIVRGMVPDTLDQVSSAKICYLSIDMNNASPEIAAATFFWERMSSGGVVVLDDYGWPKHIAQKHAFDEFARDRGVSVLSLPTGQGLLFKP